MKKTILLFSLVILGTLSVPLLAKESILPAWSNKTLIEDNLFIGLSSDNIGLQRSCALMLGKIQSDRAVIPLMEVFHSSAYENVRIAAAWALCKIGDERGVYSVKMAVKYDGCAKVQTTCAWYYENLVRQGTFTFVQPEDIVVAIAK